MPAGRDVTHRQGFRGQPGEPGNLQQPGPSVQQQPDLPIAGLPEHVESPLMPSAASNPLPGGRWLCSELLSLCWMDATGRKSSITVNLEEIWCEGAQVEAEEALPEGLQVCLTKDPGDPAASTVPGELRGIVTACHDSGTGFAVEIVFSPGYRWQPESFPPEHAVNTADLERKAAEASRHAPAASASPQDPASIADCEKRAGLSRAVSETIEQESLYRLATHASRP